MPTRGRDQEGSLRARASSPDRHLYSLFCVAIWRRFDPLSFSATTPGALPGSQVTPNFSDDQACHQTFGDHQEASCSYRYCYSAAGRRLEQGQQRLLFPKAELPPSQSLSFAPGTRTGRNKRKQAGKLCWSPSILPHLPRARAEVAGGSRYPQNLDCKYGPGCWVSR